MNQTPCGQNRVIKDSEKLVRLKRSLQRLRVAALSVIGALSFLISPLVLAEVYGDQSFDVQNPPGPVIHRWTSYDNSSTGEYREENLGGSVYAGVQDVLNCANEMEIFARGEDNALWTRWQNEDGSWSDQWASMWGIFKGNIYVRQYWSGWEGPMALGPCGIEVTIVDGNNYAIKRRPAPYISNWSDWEQHHR